MRNVAETTGESMTEAHVDQTVARARVLMAEGESAYDAVQQAAFEVSTDMGGTGYAMADNSLALREASGDIIDREDSVWPPRGA